MIFPFKFLLANLRRGKGGFFIVGPSKHLASLRHCEQAHGKCKAFIGSFSLIVPLIVLFITPSHFQKHISTQLEKYLCENNISGWANNLNFSKEFTQNYEIQNDLMFSDVFAPEFDDCTTNSSQIRESCSGDWLLATTVCFVGDAGASLSINNKCNKTMQVRRSSNCLQNVLQGNQSTLFAHLQSCKL